MNKITKENMIRWGKMALIMPIVLVWDTTFWLVTFLQKNMEKFDEWGGKLIEEFIDG